MSELTDEDLDKMDHNDIEDYFGSDYSLEEDFLAGVTCNPDAPEECESCQ